MNKFASAFTSKKQSNVPSEHVVSQQTSKERICQNEQNSRK
jgi:hypothetical protein